MRKHAWRSASGIPLVQGRKAWYLADFSDAGNMELRSPAESAPGCGEGPPPPWSKVQERPTTELPARKAQHLDDYSYQVGSIAEHCFTLLGQALGVPFFVLSFPLVLGLHQHRGLGQLGHARTSLETSVLFQIHAFPPFHSSPSQGLTTRDSSNFSVASSSQSFTPPPPYR